MAETQKTPKKEDDLLIYLHDKIRTIVSDMKTLDEGRKEAMKFYRGDSDIVEQAKGRSKAVTTDLMDVIEWVKPSLLEIFAGGDQVVALRPAGREDTQPVGLLDMLVNHQLRVKNNWFLIMYDWIDDMLKHKIGVVKYQWYKDTKYVEKDYEDLNEMELMAKQNDPNAEILSLTISKTANIPNPMDIIPIPVETPVAWNATVRHKVEDEYPLVEPVPIEEFGFPLRTRTMDDADMVYHKRMFKKWEFKKRWGDTKFKAVEGEKDLLAANKTVANERFKDLGGSSFQYDEKNQEYAVYECYYRDSETGKPKITWLCGNEVLETTDNEYDRPPFHIITTIRVAHRAIGMSLFDILKELQMVRTAFLRQVLDNMYFANRPRYFGDITRLNAEDFMNNDFPQALIRCEGAPEGIVKKEEKEILGPQFFQFWEMLKVEKDEHSGVPRAYQGVNPNVLNKTWRGQNQQVSQASQRVAMMARLIAEMGVAPLVSSIVDLNIKFLRKSTSIRYLNDWVDIHPDNIVGKFDTIVNVGLGTGDKQQIIIYMQQLLGIYAQIYTSGVPVANAQNIYNAMKELVKAMGFRNTEDFVTEPQFNEAVKQLVLFLMQSGILTKMPQLAQLVEILASGLGIKPEMLASLAQAGGTFPGQETPARPEQPENPMQITAPAQGGNFG